MLNGDKLSIFDNFKIDQNLPKWKDKIKSDKFNISTDNDPNWGVTSSWVPENPNSEILITEFQKSSIDY